MGINYQLSIIHYPLVEVTYLDELVNMSDNFQLLKSDDDVLLFI